MKYEDLLKQGELREINPGYKEQQEAVYVLDEYLEKCPTYEFSYTNASNAVEELLYRYFAVKGTPNEKIMTEILESHDFNYVHSVHNALYYLLGQKKELKELSTNPLLWPGIKNIKIFDSTYTIGTKIGTIEVVKASKIFANSKSAYIFQKTLMGEYYSRTYDFLKENPKDYRAVLAYMPNFFHEGHYHTYLESDTHVLDIAYNAYYSKEEAAKILCGDVIAKLTYEEVESEAKELQETIPEVKEKSKLHILTLYHDLKDSNPTK